MKHFLDSLHSIKTSSFFLLFRKLSPIFLGFNVKNIASSGLPLRQFQAPYQKSSLYTLICTKNQASYELAKAQQAEDIMLIEALKRMAQ